MKKLLTMPSESRVWIFSFIKKLDQQQACELLELVKTFLQSWKAHGAPLLASTEIYRDQFLLVGVDEEQIAASGCSIDTLWREIQVLTTKLNIDLADIGTVFYLNNGADIKSATREEFASLVNTGHISPDTVVFDTSITKVGDLNFFENSFIKSWHAKAFPLQQSI